MCPKNQYKMHIYCIAVFYPKDGAIIELRLYHRHAPSCPPVQPTPSQSQRSALPQAELNYRPAGLQTRHGNNRWKLRERAAQKLHVVDFTERIENLFGLSLS